MRQEKNRTYVPTGFGGFKKRGGKRDPCDEAITLGDSQNFKGSRRRRGPCGEPI